MLLDSVEITADSVTKKQLTSAICLSTDMPTQMTVRQCEIQEIICDAIICDSFDVL